MSDHDVRALASRIATIGLRTNDETRSENQLIAALRTLFHRETWPIESSEQAKLLGTDKETLEELVTRNPSAGRLFPGVDGNMVVPPIDGPKISSSMKSTYELWFSGRMRRLNKEEKRKWKVSRKTLKTFLKRKSVTSSPCHVSTRRHRKEDSEDTKEERRKKRKMKKVAKKERRLHRKQSKSMTDEAGSEKPGSETMAL